MENCLTEKRQYKIYCVFSNLLGKCYIGATSAYIWNRLLTHRAHFYQYKRRMNNTKQYDFHLQVYSSFEILSAEDHQIMLLELIPVDTDKIGISARERFHIENPPSGFQCINFRTPGSNRDIAYRNETTVCNCGKNVKNYYKKIHQKYCKAIF
jgi:hypothetical protein